MRPYDYLKERQYSWARRHGIAIDEAGYVDELNDNLFLPPTEEMLRELPRDRDGNPQESVYAAHSSAALVFNVFAYWRLYNKLGPILSTLCPDPIGHEAEKLTAEKLTFEAQCPIGWPTPQPDRKPPHLDAVITYRDRAEPSVLKGIGIESKFGEIYGQDQGSFADCYVAEENKSIWEGCESLRKLAMRINGGEKKIYRRLHVAQLIKHALGLKNQFKGMQNFELVYLWYPAPGVEAVEHEGEIKAFQTLIDSCDPRVNFRAIAYPDLIQNLAVQHGRLHGAYVDYLTERYF
jgi:hypothetical protein